MTIKNKYNHGDVVYLVTDPEQNPRVVSLLTIYPGGAVAYSLSCNGEETEHWDFEISEEVDMVKKTSN